MGHRFTFENAPQRVYWEITRACDLACRHCRAEATPNADPGELSPNEGRALLHAITQFGKPYPHVVLTGGDPLKRADFFELIDLASRLGLGVSVAPSATPLLTEEAVMAFAAHGVDAMSLSIDGSTAARHDAIRRVDGTFERTLAAAGAARSVELPFQINTLVCEETVDDLPAIHDLVCAVGASRWSLFFLVTVGRGEVLSPISSARSEQVLAWATELMRSRRGHFAPGSPVVTTTEAPQVRRVAIEQQRAHGAGHGGRPTSGDKPAEPAVPHGAGIRDGNGILFISSKGDICPSGFLEKPCGNVRHDDLVTTYREAPLFVALRDVDGFGGRCGRCEFGHVCGGSRARAWSATGDALAEDPLCPHEPAPRDNRPG
ncbi:MAG: TIGR04053 family radical SAM/SPASM domain-containing protein [Polyangiaceae bacterium]